jgi:hypothetical protein
LFLDRSNSDEKELTCVIELSKRLTWTLSEATAGPAEFKDNLTLVKAEGSLFRARKAAENEGFRLDIK